MTETETEAAHGTVRHAPVSPTPRAERAASQRNVEPVRPEADQRNGSDPSQQDDLEADMDRLSLQRALTDFDVANARVVDLTHRYVEATEEIKRLRQELEALRVEHATTLADLDRTRNTKAYKIAERIWALRRALNV